MATAVQRALEIITQAVTLDQQNRIAEAVSAYDRGLTELEAAIAQEPNLETRASLAHNAAQYIARQKKLKEFLVAAQLKGCGPLPVAAAADGDDDEGERAAPAPAGELPPKAHATAQPAAPAIHSACANQSQVDVRAVLDLPHPESLPGPDAWKIALDLVEKARLQDAAAKYDTAFALYRCALDFFARASRADDATMTADMRARITEQMRAYLDRAELLQPYATTPEASALAAAAAASSSSGGSGPAAPQKCAKCGEALGAQSVFALGKDWHPKCFIEGVRCAFCEGAFDPADMRFLMRDGKAYHPKCHDYTTGTTQETERRFFDTKGAMLLRASIERRIVRKGERIQVDVVADNSSHVPIAGVQVAMYRTEVRIVRTTGLEAKENVVVKKIGKISTQLAGKFPLEFGLASGKIEYQVPENMPSTITNDSSHILEYKLRVKFLLGKLRQDTRFDFIVVVIPKS
eukprot:m51a1_g11827 hypothetical protein (463) ;mRNA; f:426186-427803